MNDWKSRLYESYVSTEQTATIVNEKCGLSLSDYPQLEYLVRHHVPADRSIRIMDLGCGHGPLVYCLNALGYKNVGGVDVSSEQVALAHRLGITEVCQEDLFDYMRNNTEQFDIIFLMDILEHLEKQEVLDLLDLARKSLSSSGRAIIHIPNAEGIFGMRVRYGDFTHEQCFTPQSIRQVLRACRFNNITIYEDRPVIHGAKSFVRHILWKVMTLRERLLLLAETGSAGHVLSQNMLVIADI